MHNKWEFSKYILVARDKFNNLLLYNTLYMTYVFIAKSDISAFMQLFDRIRHSKIDMSNKSLNVLYNKKMVLFSDEDHNDEIKLLDERYKNVVVGDGTLNLILLPTEKCNFRCIYCYEDFTHGRMSQAVIANIKELIYEILPGYKRLHISWFGGEPLLATDTIKDISEYAIQTCKKLKKSYFSFMTTNGYFLTLDVVNELLKLHIMKFQITIDGCQNTHDKKRKLINGEGTYDVILKNLIDIRDNIKTKTIKIIIRVNVTSENSLSEIDALSAMFKDDDRFVFNIQPVFGTEKKEIISFKSTEKYYELINNCSENEFGELTADDQICYAARQNTLMIRSDGTIGKCTVNFNDTCNNFGNICNYNWSSSTIEKFCYHNSRKTDFVCVNCCLYPLCFGIQCPARKNQDCERIYRKCIAILERVNCNDQRLKLEEV